jgi:hypothetical protein
MKLLFVLIALTAATAHARQYIQCSDAQSWDRMVINLDGDDSTLFMTTGLQDPDALNILKPLKLVDVTSSHHFFKTEGDIQELIQITSSDLGVASQYFDIMITYTNVISGQTSTKQMGCFSSLYLD